MIRLITRQRGQESAVQSTSATAAVAIVAFRVVVATITATITASAMPASCCLIVLAGQVGLSLEVAGLFEAAVHFIAGAVGRAARLRLLVQQLRQGSADWRLQYPHQEARLLESGEAQQGVAWFACSRGASSSFSGWSVCWGCSMRGASSAAGRDSGYRSSPRCTWVV